MVAPRRADLEISHHYGLERFRETGLTMITVVNREYCKKLIVLLPGPAPSRAYHKIKEETFHLLHGDSCCHARRDDHQCRAGDVVTVERDTRHAFSTSGGPWSKRSRPRTSASDSYYTDPAIGTEREPQTSLRPTGWTGLRPDGARTSGW